MSLNINRETVPGVRPLFIKVLELFTGGFGWAARATTRHTDGVTLPAGTLLRVDEAARTAYPIKRGRLAESAGTAATAFMVEPGHLFEIGESIHIAGTGSSILEIRAGDTSDYIRVGGGIASTGPNGPGTVVFAGTAGALSGTANAVAAYPSTIRAGASVSVLRRGTVYGNRVPPVAANDAIPATIQFSDSQ